MDNRYEIAEQNGMSREFADWFFDNKKAGCGNVWFMMMAAMWEGWQGRAAMLQGAGDEIGSWQNDKNTPASHAYHEHIRYESNAGGNLWVQCSKQKYERMKAAGMLTRVLYERPQNQQQNIPEHIPNLREAVKTIRNSGIAIDGEKILAERDDLNSPVIPDGWVVCSERMPEPEVDVQVYCSDKKEQMVGYLERNEREGCFRFATWRNGDGIYCQPTHWMPLPAAPQQEVK